MTSEAKFTLSLVLSHFKQTLLEGKKKGCFAPICDRNNDVRLGLGWRLIAEINRCSRREASNAYVLRFFEDTCPRVAIRPQLFKERIIWYAADKIVGVYFIR